MALEVCLAHMARRHDRTTGETYYEWTCSSCGRMRISRQHVPDPCEPWTCTPCRGGHHPEPELNSNDAPVVDL